MNKSYSPFYVLVPNLKPSNWEEEKKLRQRIIKIWIFWDVMLCHWVSDAYFNGRLKTTNSVKQVSHPRWLESPTSAM